MENDLDPNSFLLYCYLNNLNYETFFFYVLPHEIAHSIGFEGGLFEGLTENIAREISAKYKLPNDPSSRADLVKLMQKLERIIGRDTLVRYSNVYNKTDTQKRDDIEELSKIINKKLFNEQAKGSNEHITFLMLYDAFKEFSEYINKLEKELEKRIQDGVISIEEARYTLQEDKRRFELMSKRNTYLSYFNTQLRNYIEKYPNDLFKLGESDLLIQDQNCSIQERRIIDFQLYEINTLKKILTQIIGKNSEINETIENKRDESTFSQDEPV